MAVRNQAVASNQNLADKPESIGPALAQVVHVDADRDVILGQAWLAAPNQLITCGHVVDQFVGSTNGLFVYFPSSGKRYPVNQVRLHPNFVRQNDGLVKYDAAVLAVHLMPPDSLALPLPFSFEQRMQANESLWTIRYPVHLGQFTADLPPISQGGDFLQYLQDGFFTHDIPLAPGDSGAPLTNGHVVVGMHCGDTASLPPFNVSVSSIRLGLGVDVMRQLGLQQTSQAKAPRPGSPLRMIAAFAVAAGLSGLLVSMLYHPAVLPVTPKEHQLMPVSVKFNEPLDGYAEGDAVQITLTATSNCYPFILLMNNKGNVAKLSPKTAFSMLPAGHFKVIDEFRSRENEHDTLSASSEDITLMLLVVDGSDDKAVSFAQNLMNDKTWPEKDNPLVNISESELMQQINDFQKEHPGLVFYEKFAVKGGKKNSDSSG